VKKIKRGFSLVEILVAIVIIFVLATVAVLKFEEMERRHRFLQAVSKVEYALRWAKVRALELSQYVKVRARGNSLEIEACGYDGNSCARDRLVVIDDDFLIEANNEFEFTPRGLSNSSGTVCVKDPELGLSYQIRINAGGIRLVQEPC